MAYVVLLLFLIKSLIIQKKKTVHRWLIIQGTITHRIVTYCTQGSLDLPQIMWLWKTSRYIFLGYIGGKDSKKKSSVEKVYKYMLDASWSLL